jgi:hypothetical protein
MTAHRRRLVAVLLLAGAPAVAWAALLARPAPLFAYGYDGASIGVHADAPIPPEAAEVVRLAEAKLARSPLFDPAQRYDVYLCSTAWRWSLFTGGNAQSGGVTHPITGSVFLRRPAFDRNRATQASGREAPGERTLDYYLAHEVGHAMTGRALGPLAAWRLPAWVREGYADYLGRGPGFDPDDARAALLGAPRVASRAQSGQYLTYALLVAQLLEREGWTVERLLHEPPPRDEVEARVRQGTIAPAR